MCPEKGITPTFLFKGWDWNPQSYSREGFGFLGIMTHGMMYIIGYFETTFIINQHVLWPMEATKGPGSDENTWDASP